MEKINMDIMMEIIEDMTKNIDNVMGKLAISSSILRATFEYNEIVDKENSQAWQHNTLLSLPRKIIVN